MEHVIDPDQTIVQTFADVAETRPQQAAVLLGESRLTYEALRDQIYALAAGLHRLGIGAGDTVATILPTSSVALSTLLAPGILGAATVPINPALRKHEVRHILADSEAVTVIAAGELDGYNYADMLATLRPDLPALRHVIVTDGPSGGRGVLSWADLTAGADAGEVGESQVDPETMTALIYTSGTTGAPKGAIHTHRALLFMADAVVNRTGPEMWKTFLNPTPLFHQAGILMTLTTLVMGGTVVLMERFNPQRAAHLIETAQVSGMVSVPTILQFMLDLPDVERHDLSCLEGIIVGGATVPGDLVREVKRRVGCGVAVILANTEAGPVAMTGLDDTPGVQAETVGRPVKGMDVRIVDAERQELPTGQTGEIACRGRHLMPGYYNRPDETAQVVDTDGWYYSGDMGYLDGTGYLHFVDRKSNVIIRGGQNVYPSEVETVLLGYPGVETAAVIGVPAAVEGERVQAYVIPGDGAALTEQELLEYCRDRIAAYKIPDVVRVVAELPLTPMGKVRKTALREQARQEAGRE